MPYHRVEIADREIIDTRGRTWRVRHDFGMPIVQPGQPDRMLVIFRAADEWLMAFAPRTDSLGPAEYLQLLERAQTRAARSPK